MNHFFLTREKLTQNKIVLRSYWGSEENRTADIIFFDFFVFGLFRVFWNFFQKRQNEMKYSPMLWHYVSFTLVQILQWTVALMQRDRILRKMQTTASSVNEPLGTEPLYNFFTASHKISEQRNEIFCRCLILLRRCYTEQLEGKSASSDEVYLLANFTIRWFLSNFRKRGCTAFLAKINENEAGEGFFKKEKELIGQSIRKEGTRKI